jgi:type VI secretion system secreted protein Hcp
VRDDNSSTTIFQGVFMAIDMFLKLGDIKGESMDSVHKEEIDIHSMQWGMAQSGSMHQGGGGGAGKVSMQNLSMRKSLDKASPNLMMACSSGKHYPEATLTVRKAGGSAPVEYMIITLKEVMVASYQTDAGNSDETLKEDITLNFGKVEVAYQPQKADGSKDGGPVKFGWNIRENVKM